MQDKNSNESIYFCWLVLYHSVFYGRNYNEEKTGKYFAFFTIYSV